jgi:hypothetical protein
MQLMLKLLNGEILKYPVKDGTVIIGRSSKCQIVVPHEGISRQHCKLEFDDGEVFVTDLGSLNGVVIQGNKITPHERTAWPTYLPLAFGPVQSLTLDTSDEKSAQGLIPELKLKESFTSTKTVSMKEVKATIEKAVSSPGAPVASIPKDNKLNFILWNIIALLILLGAVYYYIDSDHTYEKTDLSPQQPLVRKRQR